MKKIIAFLLITISCFGDLSTGNEPVYKIAWELFNHGEKEVAIKMCTTLLEEEISNIDRLHFLAALTIFTNDENPREALQQLIKDDLDCLYEYKLYYN